ncbi:Cullin binding-domain-containing protein [Truncatella angustata]|uniref:Defective in cullin neddylation protein n=1 Tax=Truncatella angustata TaxID=152316 RepID=A0A9P9A4M9_9PEZI|nr:Cullin binding-domain-containing protein [Truncatella angustata]KAH6661323.1 Cullin binding-domain-containing protein [Truncatella angustata]
MPLTSGQKNLVDHFVARTGADKKRAERISAKDDPAKSLLLFKLLKTSGWDLEAALRSHYPPGSGPSETALKSQFDSLRNAQEDAPDTIGAESAMQYLSQLGVDFEDASMFVALQVLKAEDIGDLKKEGFVKGWKEAGVDANIAAQKNYMTNQVQSLSRDPKTFREVYRHAFVLGKEGEARALTLEMATTFWQMLFKAPGRPWVGKQTGLNWLAQWLAFLEEKWTRTVSKDMWNQTYEFAVKSADDESLSFWSEDGAWPGVIDSFVAWYKAKPAEAMDVDS